MNKNPPILALLFSIVILATAGACELFGGEDEVAQIPTEVSSTITPQIPITSFNSPEPEPTATPTRIPGPTPSDTPCVLPAGWILYTVQPGETPNGIAARYGMTAEELLQANCLSSTDLVQPGQDLYVPYLITPQPTTCSPPEGWVLYTVQLGENLFRIALRYGLRTEDIQKANCLPSQDILKAGQTIYVPYLIPTPTPTKTPPR